MFCVRESVVDIMFTMKTNNLVLSKRVRFMFLTKAQCIMKNWGLRNLDKNIYWRTEERLQNNLFIIL